MHATVLCTDDKESMLVRACSRHAQAYVYEDNKEDTIHRKSKFAHNKNRHDGYTLITHERHTHKLACIPWK
jgi:hypothetical protein